MSERALRLMDVSEFLGWEDGTDTRYELIGGAPVAMAPPARPHRILAVQLAAELRSACRLRSPCIAESEAGIALSYRDDTCYIADLVVTCSPPSSEERLVRDPVLIVEILSPSTASFDRQTKVPDYRRIASVQEILLIDSRSIFAEVLRRDGERWLTEIVRGADATLTLASIGFAVRMANLYEDIDFAEPESRPRPTGA
jgi:Uma2 family endonuclease